MADMAPTITSAYDALSELSVADIVDAPELFEAAVEEQLAGDQAYKLMFEKFSTSERVLKYTDALAVELDDDINEVAEFAEIPVADPVDDKNYKFAQVTNLAIGIRISLLQKKLNDQSAVQREVRALTRSIKLKNGRAALAAVNAAGIEDYRVATAWDQDAANIKKDLIRVITMITDARDRRGNQFGYEPNILWANPTTITVMQANESIADDFRGTMAPENPFFKKVSESPRVAGALQVVPDFSIPVGEAYVAVEKQVGVEAELIAPNITPFYEERGQSGNGGATQSWRSDYSHHRALYVPAPKSIVKLSGLLTPLGG